MKTGDEVITWSEFENEVTEIACGLRALGLRCGDRLALVSENSQYLLKAWYAGLRAGFVLVPINTRLSEAEVAACLADCEAKGVVLSPEQASKVHVGSFPLSVSVVVATERAEELQVDHDLAGLRQTTASDEDWPEVGGDDLAAIFYTGGTTGGPKGVMLTHGNLVANTMNVVGPLGLNKATRYLHAAPLFHALETAGLFGVTAAAGCHYFVPRFEAAMVADVIQDHGISIVAFVPTMIASLIEHLEATGRSLSPGTLFYGGASMPEALLMRVRRVLPSTRLTQGYGQTETSPTVTLLPDEDHRHPTLKSCGIAVPSVEVSLRSPDGGIVPPGEVGEICVRGPTVMKGYWKKPAATQAAFRDGWLRTGDAARFDEDGYLYIVDRIKDFIKTGGENVFPTEVENAIYLHSAVAECAVFGIPSERWGEEIVTVVRLKDGANISPSDLQSHLRKHLGGFKIPKIIDFVKDALPQSGPGKILRNVVKQEFQKRKLAP